tara:strand:+ start:170 stop:463 length:294 start_codon:yes stop_codon:yes gene_type:complete
MNKLFNSIATATKDYAKVKAEGCKDAFTLMSNYKEVSKKYPEGDVKQTILVGLFDVERYANAMKDVKHGSERLKTLKKTGNVVTACLASTILCVLTA